MGKMTKVFAGSKISQRSRERYSEDASEKSDEEKKAEKERDASAGGGMTTLDIMVRRAQEREAKSGNSAVASTFADDAVKDAVRDHHSAEAGIDAVTSGSDVQATLELRKPPVAIGYFAEPPAGVAKYGAGPTPAGCVYWQIAQEGESFYTEPSDHYGCAVGAYTHGIDLPTARAEELPETIAFMIEQKYLAPADVESIPVLPETPRYVAYGPADAGAFEPSVVMVAAEPAQAMLLYEAALRAGAGAVVASIAGRPGCAIEPLTVRSGKVTLSLGCKGNRTFTGLPDGELYVSVPGEQWAAVAAALGEIVEANRSMGEHYQGKLEEGRG